MANFFVDYIFKNSVFYMILTALLCLLLNIGINLAFSYLYIFLLNKFLESLYYLKYILIPVLFIYNYLILRKIVITWLYEWQFPFQIFSIYRERQTYVSFLKERVTYFSNAIDVLLDSQYKLTENEIGEIEYFLDIFNEEFIIYNDLYNIVFGNNGFNNNNLIRYKMSQCQINYYNLLNAINSILNENNLGNNLRKIRQNNYFENSIKIEKNNDLIQSLSSLKIRLNELMNIIEKYNSDNYTYMSPAYIFNLIFNDTFGSLSLYSIRFKKNYQEYELEENYTQNGKIHYTLILNNNIQKNGENNLIKIEEENDIIKENKNINKESTLLFFSLPNGGCYELIPKTKIKFYLSNGFSFLCWNYRGYGHSKGSANFSNCRSDALEVFDTITKNNKYNFKKICVMGHSIGGITNSHISKNRKVDLVISDRNFCDIPRIAKNFHCGNVLSFITKFLLIGNTNIIEDYLNNDNFVKEDRINRIIIYSPNDTLIDNDCTVKSGISRYIIKKYVIYKKAENDIIQNKENLLDLVFNSTEKENFLQNLINFISVNKNFAINFKNGETKMYIDNDITLSFLDKFYGICCDNLTYITENNKSIRRQKLFLDSFFNNLLIWGGQNSSEQNDDLFDFEFIADKGFKIIKEACDILDNVNDNNNNKNIFINNMKLSLIQNIKKDFKKILMVMEKLDIKINNSDDKGKRVSLKLSNINNTNIKEKLIISDEEEDTEINTNSNNNLIDDSNNNMIKIGANFYQKLHDILGNFKLFKTYIGHNGFLREDEREKFFIFLLRSGVIS